MSNKDPMCETPPESTIADHLRWVLPMARGWAALHPVGSNQQIVNDAEAALSAPSQSPAARDECENCGAEVVSRIQCDVCGHEPQSPAVQVDRDGERFRFWFEHEMIIDYQNWNGGPIDAWREFLDVSMAQATKSGVTP